jgi:hypothetical protein
MAELAMITLAASAAAGTGLAISQALDEPDVPKALTPPSLDPAGQAKIEAAALAERRRRALASGRQSTLLTDKPMTPLSQQFGAGDIRSNTLLGG